METKVEEKNNLSVIRHEHLQMVPMEEAKSWYNDFVAFTKSILKEGLDFGVIPGTPKPSLYKPGAEKLRFVYGLGVELECTEKIVDLDRLYVDYSYKASVISKTGQMLAQCEGNCNSMEPKFGYLWKTEHELPQGTDINKMQSKTTGKKLSEFAFAINKAETGGQYGKPQEYWDRWHKAIADNTAKLVKRKSSKGNELDAYELDETVTVYRITNPDVVGAKNTIMKMAQKRAIVGAILIATGASEFFTQDIEDMEINGAIHSNDHPIQEAEIISSTTNKPAAPVETKKDETKPFVIPGHWYAKLEKCKYKQDVDELAKTYNATLTANPEIRQLFVDTRTKLPSLPKQQEVNHA